MAKDQSITPTIGRVVWTRFVESEEDETVRPGIVVEVHSDTCIGVKIFNPSGETYHSHVEQSEGLKTVQGWDWMPYQKQQAAKASEETQKQDEPKKGEPKKGKVEDQK